jgi:hypothetical protein
MKAKTKTSLRRLRARLRARGRLPLLLVLAFVLCVMASKAAYGIGKVQGDFEFGGERAITNLSGDSIRVQRSCPGGTIAVYVNGTTTLATIYASAALAPKSPMFAADSRGHYEFWTDEPSVKIIFDGCGSTYTRSDIVVSSASGTGGLFNVVSYGAEGDGTTVDDAAFDLALADAAAAGGGTIDVSCGTYRLTDLTITDDNIRLAGRGDCTVLDFSASATAAHITVGVPDSEPVRYQITSNVGGTAQTRSVIIRRGPTTAGVGSINVTASSTAFTGSGLTDLASGSIVEVGTTQALIKTITGGISGTFVSAWTGSTAAAASYSVASHDLAYPDADVSVTGISSVLQKLTADMTGTVTVTSGSTALTGSGTNFDPELLTDCVSGATYQILAPNGVVASIASVTNDTAAVLSANWAGPTQDGVPFKRICTKTYTATTDYLVGSSVATYDGSTRAAGVNNFIIWSPAGAEPAAQSIYEATATFIPGGADRDVVVSDIGTLAVGDWVAVVSDVEMYDWERLTYTKGEVAKIDSIAGTTITFTQPLRDAYLANTSYVIELDTISGVQMRDFTLKGNSAISSAGVTGYWLDRFLMERVKIYNTGKNGLLVFGSIDSTVRDTQIFDSYLGSGAEYGIWCGSCTNFLGQHLRIDGGQHGFDVSMASYSNGVDAVGWGPGTGIVLRDSYVAADLAESRQSVNSHIARDFDVVSNTLANGVNLSACRSCRVLNNEINAPSNKSAIDTHAGTWIDSLSIRGNRITHSGSVGAILLRYQPSLRGPYMIAHTEVLDNIISQASQTFSLIAIGDSGTSANYGVRIRTMNISGNTEVRPNLTTGLFVTTTLRHILALDAITIADNVVYSGIILEPAYAKRISVLDNTFTRTIGDGYTHEAIQIGINSANFPQNYDGFMLIHGNKINGFNQAAINLTTQFATDATIAYNHFDGNGAGSVGQINVAPAGSAAVGGTVINRLIVRGNTFRNTLGSAIIPVCVRLNPAAGSTITGSISENLFDACTSGIGIVTASRASVRTSGNVMSTAGNAPPVITAAQTLAYEDQTRQLNATGGAFALTIPSAAAACGKSYVLQKIDNSANAITLTATGSDTINGSATNATVFGATTQWATSTLTSDCVSEWILK